MDEIGQEEGKDDKEHTQLEDNVHSHQHGSVQAPSAEQQIKPEPETPAPPPDVGLQAWTQCACTFCLWFAAWGLVNSFGVFQSYYETQKLPEASSSSISWIGSVQLCIFIAGTSIVGPLFDIGYLRALLSLGTLLTVLGMMCTSAADAYWQFVLSQGVCMGLGMTCLFVPMIAVLPPYFGAKRSLAMGVAAAGSSIGAIIFTIVFQQLLPRVGFGWTTRTIAFILLASMVLPVAVMKKRTPRAARRALVDRTAFREPAFVLVFIAMFIVFAGMYVPYFYVEVFSLREGLLIESNAYLGQYLIVFMNTGSAAGRLLPNFLADKTGPFNNIILVSLITGVIGLAWISVNTGGSLIAFCVFYGFFSGSFVALAPIVWFMLSPNLQVLGTRTGMLSVPMAAGLLIGNPIAGALVKHHNFVGLQVFCGCTVICGGVFLLMARVAHGRGKRDWRF